MDDIRQAKIGNKKTAVAPRFLSPKILPVRKLTPAPAMLPLHAHIHNDDHKLLPGTSARKHSASILSDKFFAGYHKQEVLSILFDENLQEKFHFEIIIAFTLYAYFYIVHCPL